MKRREFIKSVGIAGTCSLAGILTMQGPYGARVEAIAETGSRREQSPPTDMGGPFDLALDRSGGILVTDSPRYRWLQIDTVNGRLVSFGKPGSIVGRLNFPAGIAVGPDNLVHIVDSNNCRVQVFDMDGNVKRVVGSIGSIGGSFATPQGICLDGTGKMLVADTRNHRVQIFSNYELVAVIGDLGDAEDQFRLPTACALSPEGHVLVLDSKHGTVKVFSEDLKFRFSFGAVGSSPGMLNMPQGMDFAPDGTVWIADTGNHRIQQFSMDGKLISVVGKNGSGSGEFKNPTGIACRDENVYIADNGNRRIQILTKGGFEVLKIRRDTSEPLASQTRCTGRALARKRIFS